MKNSYKKKTSIKRRHHQRRRRHTYRHGGKPINSGSYGCVFKPPINCDKTKSDWVPTDSNGISKLMRTNNAQDEMNEIKKVQSNIKSIPNSADYFLVENTHICTPDKLSFNDLQDFDSICDGIVSNTGYTNHTINSHLNELKIINIPYGGLDIEQFCNRIINRKDINSLILILNKALIRLLKNGITAINKEGYYHMDVKGPNILISDDMLNARLIDWGISKKISIPATLEDYSNFITGFQYNVPFSNILLNQNINDWLKDEFYFLKTKTNRNTSTSTSRKTGIHTNKSISLLTMKKIAKNIIKKTIETLGEGHLTYMVYYISIVYHYYKNLPLSHPLSNNRQITLDIISTYLAPILVKYTNPTTFIFDIERFCKEVYLPNVDVWGFIMSYIHLLVSSFNAKNNSINPLFLQHLSKIVITYCYESTYAIKPIPIKTLISDLEKLEYYL